jgi:GNAT superfamily N-acetyltransferase
MAKLGEHYASYSLEENGYNIVTKDYGFFTYLVEGAEFFVGDIYISPDYRNNQLSLELLKDMKLLAKQAKCPIISANTYKEDEKDFERYTRKVRLMIDAGFKIKSVMEHNIIWYMEV